MKPENVVKLCDCGCGQPTRLATKTSASAGHVQGQPLRFVFGHRRAHGHTVGKRSPEFVAWQSMKKRCTPAWEKHHLYYDRGIRVCAAWENDFAAFLAHVGSKPPGTQLDRIENARGYEPGNVRWATLSIQRQNQRPRTPYGPRKRDQRWITPENPTGLRTTDYEPEDQS